MTARPLIYVRARDQRIIGYRAGCLDEKCRRGEEKIHWVSKLFNAWFPAKMEAVLHNLEEHEDEHGVRDDTARGASLLPHVRQRMHGHREAGGLLR